MIRRVLISLLLIQVAFGARIGFQRRYPKVPYIVGGSDADSGQFPWQVSLRDALNSHFCGGSIINKKTVLTAAHCTVDDTTSNIKVYVGSTSLDSGTKHDVQEILIHGNYDRHTLANDVSILHVSPDITLNSLVQTIPLINRDVSNEELEVSGWGQTGTHAPIPTNLKWIKTTAMSHDVCAQIITTNDDTVCAFSKFALQ